LRLVASEGDGLSGLTVDRFDRFLVVQFTALGLAQKRDLLADLLAELVEPAGIFLRTERGIGQLEGLSLQDEPLRGEAPAGLLSIENMVCASWCIWPRGKRPAFTSISATIASRSPNWPRAGGCWTPSVTAAGSGCTPLAPG